MRHRSPPGWPIGSARLVARWVLVSLALLAVLTALIGLAFAGSSVRIADGVQIAGVDVGGLTQKEAQTLLERRFERVARVPVVFTAGDKEYPIKATTLGVEADWATAIESAAREGEGFGPVRGFKRLQTRFFGSEIAPPVRAYEAALDFKLAGLARDDRPAARRGEARPPRARRRGRSGPARPAARQRHRRGADRPCARAARARPADRAAGAARPGRGDRGRPRSRGRTGAGRAVGTRPARVRRHALEAAALADRRAAQPAGRRRDRRRDRGPRRGGLVQEAAQDRRAGARRRGVRRQAGWQSTSSRDKDGPERRRARDREGAAGRGDLGDRADRTALRPHRPGRALDGRGAGDGDHRRRRQLLHDATAASRAGCTTSRSWRS